MPLCDANSKYELDLHCETFTKNTANLSKINIFYAILTKEKKFKISITEK